MFCRMADGVYNEPGPRDWSHGEKEVYQIGLFNATADGRCVTLANFFQFMSVSICARALSY